MNVRSLRAMRPGRRILLAAGVLVLGAAMLAMALRDRPAAASGASAAAPAQASAGSFRPTKAQLEGLKIETVEATSFRGEQITDGVIASNDDTTTPVFSPYTGRVSKLFAKLGDNVREGTPLMAVEASEFVQVQNDLVAAVAALASTHAQLELAQAAERRQHELYLAKSGAMKDWLQSQSDLITAQGNARSAEIALEAARNRLRILGASAQEISALEAARPSQQMNPVAVLRSPIAGTVIQRQVGLGQYIQSAAGGAANPVYAIGNLSTVWLVANVREVDAPRLKLGQAVEVKVLALPDRVFKARLSWIASAIDPNTRRLAVRAEVENRDGALKPMMFATFRLLTEDAVTAPGIPQSAIVYEGSDAHVFVDRSDGTLAVRAIHAGRSSGDRVEVTQGLAVGEKVVTSGALFIDRATENR